jgi:hypothetical protein
MCVKIAGLQPNPNVFSSHTTHIAACEWCTNITCVGLVTPVCLGLSIQTAGAVVGL